MTLTQTEAPAVDTSSSGAPPSSSVGKALAVLELVAMSDGDGVGVSEIALLMGIPKSTAHRLLGSLSEGGFIQRSGTKYCLGSKFLSLSAATRLPGYSSLRDVATPALERLSDRLGCTVQLGMLDGAEVLCLLNINRRGGYQIPLGVGGRLPATCTALGKAILAFADRQLWETALSSPLPCLTPYSIVTGHVLRDELAKVKTEGVAFEHEEARLGVTCVAAPIVRDSRVIAAVSVGGRTYDSAQMLWQVDAVRETAAAIAARLRLPS